MAGSCFPAFCLGKAKSKRLAMPSTSRDQMNSETENMERKRFDSLESWSMILESENVETWEASKEDQEEWTADLSQLFIGNKFASGAHSRIYRGIYKQRAVAVKMVRIPNQKEETRSLLEQQFKCEVALLSRLYHPNIVQFIAACKKPPVYCIITEYMSQGTLRMYLNKKEPYSLSTETVLRLALDISRGMEYLHSQGVIHRDLKSNNLLLNDEMRVKVADFGTSCLETQCQETKGNKGTYRWMAPEMIKEKPYTRKVDVYSFGIVLWELTTALLPFQGMTPVQAAFAVAEKKERPPLPASCQPALAHLIRCCWAANPSKRPDFSDIVCALEKYDECVKEGLPLTSHAKLVSRSIILERLKGCVPIEMLSSRQLLNFFTRKDARKILKRKDSDAGEPGRALEELRASLFNRLRSSEYAKRHEQRRCGPVVALTFNFIVAVGIIFINKWVFQGAGFRYPICLSFIHYAISWILMAILKALSVLPAPPPSKPNHLTLFTLGFVMSLSTGLANVSLKYNSVGFYQMAKIVVTPSIVLAQFIWFGKTVSFSKVVALTVASTGVALATVTDLQFSLFGACVALAWIIPSAVNKIMWSTMQQRDNWTAMALMWKTTPITLIFLAALIPFFDPSGVLSYDWNLSNTTLIITSALFGFLLQWSGALALGATSAISHVVLGQFKTCVVLLGNYYIFGSNPGVTSIIGAVIAICGMSGYTYLNLQQNSKSQTAAQISTVKDKSRLSKENGGDTNDGYGQESV
ncbi:Serine/threonine/tyrosine-protein kinase HT1 [Linum perenne]